ncbi:MAG: lipoyl(octanoyl) transferase LipB [Thermodesulfobacteriota bacterium]
MLSTERARRIPADASYSALFHLEADPDYGRICYTQSEKDDGKGYRMRLFVVNLGRADYQETLLIQEMLFRKRQHEEIEDLMLLLEHPPTLTLGLRGRESNITASREQLKTWGVGIFKVYRGGDVTYHGPGQIVGYPILNLSHHGKDVRKFIWKIEETFIRLLNEEYGLHARRIDNHTGVWLGNEKIAAIGCSIRRWVTMHGFAFNVNTNLEHFKWIHPCGIPDKGVTSLQKEIGRPLDMDVLFAQVATYFAGQFGLEPKFIHPSILDAWAKSEENA